MRFIFGLIVGALLTVGTAYVADSFHAAPAPGQKEEARMVNWDVVSANMQGLSTDLREAWTRLVGGAKELDKKAGV